MNTANTFELYGKYKNLYLFNSGRGSVLFKSLSYEDCETAKRICNNYPALAPVVEDDIWKECVIESTLSGTVDTLNAGIVSTIVRLILGFSNPTSLKDIDFEITKIRDESQNIREDMIIKICQAFPAYKPEDVEAMEWKTQLKRLVQAEKILGASFAFTDNKDKNKPKDAPAMKEVNGQQFIDFGKENQVLMDS